ncbi:MAG: tRNA (adenosine(37)-N6)-threonylcarbamoyltransferase complex ATPase subunit type 1 TsaE [Chloroflexota bacterium]
MTQIERIHTDSADETVTLGRRIGRDLAGGDVVLIEGPLGAGKTVLARGIVAARSEQRFRGSPTFNLIYEYAGDPRLYHLDLYRLGPKDVEDLGLEEILRPDSIVLVEWPERADRYLRELAPAAARISLQPDREGGRSIEISWTNDGASGN